MSSVTIAPSLSFTIDDTKQLPIAPLLNRTTADNAMAVVTEFLLDHVGNQLIAGEPVLMVSALHTLWAVPVQLAYLSTGVVGNVGMIAVDDETARVIAWTPIAQIKAASRALRARLEPQLSQQFQQQMTATSPSKLESIPL